MAGNGRSSLQDQCATAFVLAFIATIALNFSGYKDLAVEIAVYGWGGGVLLWVIVSLVTWKPIEYFWMAALSTAAVAGVGLAMAGLQAVG